MPARGAAILSQIEGLLEQLTELDYDTPVKEWASQLMPEVRQQADAIRSADEVDSPDMELAEGTEGTVPPVEPRPSEAEVPAEDQEKDFAAARGGAKAFLAQTKTPEEQSEDPKKKKRTKAY
jgi:hypothetical protein